MLPDDEPIKRERDFVRVAVQALHEAFGTPVTRCAQLNRVIREYPDGATDENLALFLADHDSGECSCERTVVANATGS